MMTALPKHRGQHAGLIALCVLVITVTVVWTTHPRTRARPVEPDQPDGPHVTSSTQRPAVAAEPAALTPSVKTSEATLQRGFFMATGFTSYDENKTSHLSPPVHGWMKKKRSTSLGRRVQAGEALATIYSPEVYLATVDLVAEARDFRTQEQLDAQRYRLFGYGMQRAIVDRIEKTLKPQPTLPLVSRVAGTVIVDEGKPGQLVDPAETRELFTITDPSALWAFVEIPDDVVTRVHEGTPAKLTIDGQPRPLSAKVAYVFRRSDDGMRTVRFDLRGANLATKIKPRTAVKAELDLRASVSPARTSATPPP